MKGISLPINVVVVVALVALVLVVIGYFFVSGTSGPISRTENERVFSEGCSALCRDPCKSAFLISHSGAADRTDFHSKFAKACVSLGYAANPEASGDVGVSDAKTCLTACGSCVVECSQDEYPLLP